MPHAVRLCYRPRQVGAAGVETAGRWETAPSPPGRTVDIALRLVLASAHAMPRGVCRRQETARGPGHVTAARSVGRHPHPPEGETGHAAWRPVRDGAPPRPGATRGCAHAWLPRRPGLPSALAPAAWERSRARRHWALGHAAAPGLQTRPRTTARGRVQPSPPPGSRPLRDPARHAGPPRPVDAAWARHPRGPARGDGRQPPRVPAPPRAAAPRPDDGPATRAGRATALAGAPSVVPRGAGAAHAPAPSAGDAAAGRQEHRVRESAARQRP